MFRFVLILVLAVPAMTSAQNVNPQKAAQAEALFRDGRALMKAKKAKKACPKLARSLELDRAIGTLWHLARCYEMTGRNASAWALFLEVAADARRAGREQQKQAATQRAEALEPRLCRIRLQVNADASVNIKVSVAGRQFARASWNTAVPVDCGTVSIRAVRDGGIYEGEATADKPGKTTDVEVPVPDPVLPAKPEPKRSVLQVDKPWYRDTVGLAFAGAAVAGAGLGLVFRSVGNARETDAGEAGLDLATRDALLDSADRNRTIAAIAFGAGGAAIVGAVLKFWFFPARTERIVVESTGDGASAALSWSF